MAVVTPAPRIGKTTGDAAPKRRKSLPPRKPSAKVPLKQKHAGTGLINR